MQGCVYVTKSCQNQRAEMACNAGTSQLKLWPGRRRSRTEPGFLIPMYTQAASLLPDSSRVEGKLSRARVLVGFR